jgi:cytochrome c biogenesis protein
MGNGSRRLRSAGRTLWRTLGSTRLAAILLAALAGTVLLTALLPQMPVEPAAREPWFAAVRLRFGGATGLLQALGLFDAYRAPGFLALLAALLLNTVICTVQRLPRLWRALTARPPMARPEAFFAGAPQRADWSLPSLPDGLSAAQAALARHRYRQHLERDDVVGTTHLYAERGRWAGAGTLISHLAALLLLLALLARPALAWQDTGLRLLPEQAQPVGRGTGLIVQAGPLSIDRYPDGQPRDYRVPLAVLLDNSLVMTRTVRLNHPLTYHGIHFHLQGYGVMAQLTAPEGTFALAFPGGAAQEVALPQAGLTLRLAYQPGAAPAEGEGGTLFVEAWTPEGALLGSGTVADGNQIEVEGTPLRFQLGHYTTWQVGRDPTFGPALVAAGLLLAGILISLWVPQRRLWLRLDGRRAQMAASADWHGEFDRLAAEVAATSAPAVDAEGATPIGPPAPDGDSGGR